MEPPRIDLAGALSRFDPMARTELCGIMHGCGSDKGLGWHNYTSLYSDLLAPLRERPAVRVFELGIGSTDPGVPCNMGAAGTPGASLRGWARWLPRASVFGADVDRASLFQEERIRTFHVDQRDPASVAALWAEPELAREGFDLIVDDGLHEYDANVTFFEGSWRMLKPGGVFVVEDLLPATLERLEAKASEWRADPAFEGLEIATARLPHPTNPHDNAVMIAARRA